MLFQIAQIIREVINILIFLIVIRVILSYIPHLISPNSKLVTLLYDVTDPILKPFQSLQFGGGGMSFDLSPLVAIIVLELIRSVIWRLF